MTLKTNTAAFRLALSVAALWLAYVGYLTVTAYQDATSRPNPFEFSIQQYSHCHSPKTDRIYPIHTSREPTAEEVQECRKAVDEEWTSLNGDLSWWDKKIRERNAISSFAEKGLLPAGILLLIAALWGPIANLGRSYVAWVKDGKSTPDE